jgi:TrmH family RNA methyltransferase
LISKNQFKYIRSLHQKKFRDHHQQFILEGIRSFSSAMGANGEIEQIVFTSSFAQKHAEILDKMREYPQNLISENELKQLSPSTSPPGVLAVCNQIEFDLINPEQNVIYLDQVSDPGNMGTILRTAVWFGVNQIALSPGCIDLFNPKVVRSAMGAHFNLLWVGELSFDALEGYSCLGADHRGESLHNLNPIPEKWALIMGSEAHGLSNDVKAQLDQTITIPKIGIGESLNVGVAMGILLYRLTQ